MYRYWWTVEIKLDSGAWFPHWGEYTRAKARKVATSLRGAVRGVRIVGHDFMNPDRPLRG